MGKISKRWEKDKKKWYKENPPDPDPYPHYVCYLPGHGEWLRPPEHLAGFDNPLLARVTLDHKESRGRHPERRTDLSNFHPCCLKGNQDKGSLSLEEYRVKMGIEETLGSTDM